MESVAVQYISQVLHFFTNATSREAKRVQMKQN